MQSQIIGRRKQPQNHINQDQKDPNQKFQTQLQVQVDVEVQDQLKMVIDDFKNVMGIVFETQAILDTFQNDHEMVTINLNKLFLQVNISNAIHFDLDKQTRNKKKLLEQKQIAIDMTLKFMQKYIFDQRIADQIKRYLNHNLNQNPIIKQQALVLNSSQSFDLNSKLVQKVINSMGQVDMEFNQLRQGHIYQIPKFEEVEKINQQRHQSAMLKCYANFQGQQLQQFLTETYNSLLPQVQQQFSQIIVLLKSKDVLALNQIQLLQETIKYIEKFNQVHKQINISKVFTTFLENNLKKEDLNLQMKDKVVILLVHQILGLQ